MTAIRLVIASRQLILLLPPQWALLLSCQLPRPAEIPTAVQQGAVNDAGGSHDCQPLADAPDDDLLLTELFLWLSQLRLRRGPFSTILSTMTKKYPLCFCSIDKL